MKTRKRLLAMALAFIFAFALFPTTALHASDITVTIDGAQVNFADQQPTIIDGRTLVPVRGVFEQLGFEVDWDGEARQAILESEDYTVIITIDSATFTTNGVSHEFDVPAQIIGGSTMVPIRFVLESVGYYLDWDGGTNTVLISATPIEGQGAVAVTPPQDFDNEVIADFLSQFTSLFSLGRRFEDGTIGGVGIRPENNLPLVIIGGEAVISSAPGVVAIGWAENLFDYDGNEITEAPFLYHETYIERIATSFTLHNIDNSNTPDILITFRDARNIFTNWWFYPDYVKQYRFTAGAYRHVYTFDLSDGGQPLAEFPALTGLQNEIRNIVYEAKGLPTYILIGGELFHPTATEIVLAGRELTNVDFAVLLSFTNLQQLNLSNSQITDLTPLAGLTNLEWLSLGNNQITDLTPLAGMTDLGLLNLGNNQITDLTPLAGMTDLGLLNLGNNQITDLSPLAGLTNLTDLTLTDNQITDLTPLAGLTNLANLFLLDNQITDLAPLAGMTDLERIDLSNNQIIDITPLAGLTNLTNLTLTDNQITDLTPLAGMTDLGLLNLGNNQIIDITPLAGLTNLGSLNLTDNQIIDITPLAGLTNLGGLNLTDNQIIDITTAIATTLAGLENLRLLHLSVNQISDIAPLAEFTNLTTLGLNNSQITDLTPLIPILSEMTNLTILHLGNNQITDIAPLAGLTDLEWLGLANNQITDLTPLAGLTDLWWLNLANNPITDWSPVAHVGTVIGRPAD